MEHHKPPLGLKPRSIFLEERAEAITEAIQRQFESGQEIPVNWIEEYNIIRCELNGGSLQWIDKNKIRMPLGFLSHPNT